MHDDGVLDLLIVEPDPDVRESLTYLLGAEPGLSVVCAFRWGLDAVAWLAQGNDADVALVDLGLPDLPGVVCIARLKALRPAMEVVVVSVHEDESRILGAFHAGAVGYLLKDCAPEMLIAAVREAASGGAPMSPRVARRVVSRLPAPSSPCPLTQRERDVLVCLAHGNTYDDIGRALSIGIGTVQTHIKSIYRKLGVATKAEAALRSSTARSPGTKG